MTHYTKTRGRLPKVGLGLVPGLLVQTSVNKIVKLLLLVFATSALRHMAVYIKKRKKITASSLLPLDAFIPFAVLTTRTSFAARNADNRW